MVGECSVALAEPRLCALLEVMFFDRDWNCKVSAHNAPGVAIEPIVTSHDVPAGVINVDNAEKRQM